MSSYLVKRASTSWGWSDSLLSPAFGFFYMLAFIYFLFVAKVLSLAFLFAIAAAYVFPTILVSPYIALNRVLRRSGYNGNLVTGLLLGLLTGIFYWTPVFAQAVQTACGNQPSRGLFSGAENLMRRLVTNSITQQDQQNFCNIIAIVVNSLRAVFVIYLIVGLVQVINSVRQGEEWKDVARMPLIVFLVGIFGDLLIGFISGA